MFLLILKYLTISLVFLAVYRVCLMVNRPALERVWMVWRRWQSRYLKGIENLQAKGDRLFHWDARQTYHASLMAAVAGALLGLFFFGDSLLQPAAWALALGCATLGFCLPRAYLILRKRQRRRALESQLPVALEMAANSLRAGLSLLQALEMAAREAPHPIAREFGEAVRDIRLGLSPEAALAKMSRHWKNSDLDLFVVAAEVSRRTGGNLADIAGNIVATIHERARLQGRIATLTAQGKLSGWVVGLLPVGLLIVMSLLDPQLIGGFLHSSLGWLILGGGAFMELAGAFFISRIVKIDV